MSVSTNNYELTFILGEAATAEQAAAKSKELAKTISTMDGEVSKEEQWGRRELAYPIKRNRSGMYVTMWFSLPAKEVSPLERILRFDESIIRSLITTAYTSAQPGSLYPVVEEEKTAKPGRASRKDEAGTGSAEEELRRHTTTTKAKTAKKDVEAEDEDELSEEDRLKALDTQLDELLKDEEGSN